MTTAQQRDLSTAEVQQAAQKSVRDYIAIHKREPTGEMIGKQFGMGERWGRNQIAAVREQGGGTAPARRHGTSGTARPTVADAVAARESVPAPARATFGAGPAAQPSGTGAARPAAQPAAPPARTGTASGTSAGTGAARPPHPSGTAKQRDERAAARDRHSGGGQLVAWAGFALGSLVSIAANVMYSWLNSPEDAGPDWSPSVGEQVMAGIWPTLLLIAVEVMTRVNWAPGWHWTAARYGGAGVVGLGSAVISYGHLHGVLTIWNYDDLGASVGPLVVDGLMVICGFALLSTSQARHGTKS